MTRHIFWKKVFIGIITIIVMIIFLSSLNDWILGMLGVSVPSWSSRIFQILMVPANIVITNVAFNYATGWHFPDVLNQLLTKNSKRESKDPWSD